LLDWLAYGTQGIATGTPRPLAEGRLLAPVPPPGKIICGGLNYREHARGAVWARWPRPGKIIGVGLTYRAHARETGQPIPDQPVLFSKYANSVVGPGADVVVPPEAEKVDYEAELAVVVGPRTSRVAAADALDHVAGYACANDVSSRSLQFLSGQWLLGK